MDGGDGGDGRDVCLVGGGWGNNPLILSIPVQTVWLLDSARRVVVIPRGLCHSERSEESPVFVERRDASVEILHSAPLRSE